jgi:hypothetical protein
VSKYAAIGYKELESEIGSYLIMGKDSNFARIYIDKSTGTIQEEEFTR